MRGLLAVSMLVLIPFAVIAAEKPNVIVVLLDDAGQRDFGCYGSTYHKTPNLDAFAKQAVQFTDATSACPVCSPTRAAILTGQNPARFGLTDWLPGQPDKPGFRLARPALPTGLPLTATTLAEALKPAGYTTGHVGKWHLGGEGLLPAQQGFDFGIAASHIGHPPSYFAPYANKNAKIPGLDDAPKGEYLTDRLTDEAIKFMTTNRTKPFYLQLAHYAPHTPLQAKPETIAKYKALPAGRQGNPTYAAMIENLDDNMGRLFKALEDLKLSDNTYIFLTSDNGGLATLEGMPSAPTFNGPYREGKGYLYEGGLRVPFLVRGPGVKAGTTKAACNSIDIFPTVLDLCGASAKAVDGVSLKPVLMGEAQPARELYWHYPHYANQGGRPGGIVRVGNMKLIEFYEENRRELFDLSKDVGESKNLAVEKPEVVKELAAKLDAWRKSIDAKMPTPNPAYRPNPPAANGTITLPARTALVTGTQLRFEPLPHKNTLGYWVKLEDTATFDFTVTTSGTYTVEVLQGCGNGSGGSEVEMSVNGVSLKFTVKETGGFKTSRSAKSAD
jgi:arylsulfatase A